MFGLVDLVCMFIWNVCFILFVWISLCQCIFSHTVSMSPGRLSACFVADCQHVFLGMDSPGQGHGQSGSGTWAGTGTCLVLLI